MNSGSLGCIAWFLWVIMFGIDNGCFDFEWQVFGESGVWNKQRFLRLYYQAFGYFVFGMENGLEW